jgi:hypothetical protein
MLFSEVHITHFLNTALILTALGVAALLWSVVKITGKVSGKSAFL